jgi:LysM repeat protein
MKAKSPKRFYKRLGKSSQKRLIKVSIVIANVAVLVTVGFFVLRTPHNVDVTAANSVSASINNDNNAVNALDQLSAADIAVHVARLTGLEEAVSVANNADSMNAQLAVSAADSTIVAKPQVISTTLKSRRDIQFYQVQAGDTVPKLAAKFGITSDTIRWSNGLSGDSLEVGKQLVISPVNGVAYKVKAGDTVDSLATRFKGYKDQIIAFNDAEIGGLPVGQYVVIPDGTLQVAAPITSLAFRLLGGGGYDRGWCTYYAAAKAGVPGGWGNANTWHIYAPLSGWTVSTTPRVGAVAQNSAGWAGHVGIVEAVSADGTMIKYSDMNGLAGFNRVGYSDWVPARSKFQRFIYH